MIHGLFFQRVLAAEQTLLKYYSGQRGVSVCVCVYIYIYIYACTYGLQIHVKNVCVSGTGCMGKCSLFLDAATALS